MKVFNHSRNWDQGVFISNLFKRQLEMVGYVVEDFTEISTINYNDNYKFAFGWGLSDKLKKVRDELKIPTFVFDLGMIKRTETPKTSDGYFRCGIGSEKWINWGRKHNKDRFHELGIKFKNNYCKDGTIAFMGQVPGDVSHGMAEDELIDWTKNILFKLKDRYSNPILYKLHPHTLHRLKHKELLNDLQKNGIIVDSSGKRIEEYDVDNFRSVFSYCSTSLVHFIINGIPIVASKKSMFNNLCGDIDNYSNWDVDFLPNLDYKQEWFNAISYSQWNKQEIADGTLLKELQKYIND